VLTPGGTMAGQFFERLKDYYESVAQVLRGEANAASIFPNTTDIGSSRERVYAEFLKQHAPSKCNVFFGGFLFDRHGAESKQLDVIVTTDTTPRFDLHNTSGAGKAFSPVEGTLLVASIKSTLDKKQLDEALDGIASIPPTESLEGRVNPSVTIGGYEGWPLKVVYASDGIAGQTLIAHMKAFYDSYPQIPQSRRPDYIHVSDKYFVLRIRPGMTFHKTDQLAGFRPAVGDFVLMTRNPDLHGILWVLETLQKLATASTHIVYRYDYIVDKILSLGLEEQLREFEGRADAATHARSD
jgi:hypothetical protein